jgi:cysteine desulfurase
MKHIIKIAAQSRLLSNAPFFCFGNSKPQYFDYQATTPIDYRVLDAMMPYMTQHYGNPHSKTHQFGWESSTAIENARKQVADLIGADEK